MKSIGVLFVCLGNICRSPAAHAVFAAMIESRGLQTRLHVDSCATASFHIGKPPDPRSVAAAARRGYGVPARPARQITDADFLHFDYIVAVDRNNLRTLQGWAPAGFSGTIELLTRFDPTSGGEDIADPFYGSPQDFDTTLVLIERSITALFAHLCRVHRL
ncbi:MAG: low molecular weight phosphotyrosine protein phosphatase [Pseudomonadales bacterium]|nr:low molecular weight phosphotyrosine protein phosphatase [Pseudomonadales bacterium]MCP5320456.1 low molecular weight phosphotyrosine protein phosphatase [Pseudomonadales bacterium]MCP5336786.1 low molecular weight phosphotyrosine protein phosphatase [Pseudomonadales bacterium]